MIAQALKGRPYSSPGKVQRSHLPPAPSEGGGVSLPFVEGWGRVLHSRGAQVFLDAPAVSRAKGRGMHCIPALTHGVIHRQPLRGLRRI